VQLWAKSVEGRFAVVIVAREELVCPEKTGLLVAAEEGLHANIFTSESGAVAWLEAHPATATGDGV
jgi:hypothetical protein